PQSIRSVELLSDIQNLKNDEAISRKEYVFNNEKAQSKTITIKPAPVMIIEGLFIYHYPELRSLFDLKLFVHAKDNLKLIRRIKRDRVERNYPLEDVIYRYEHHVMPAFEKYIEAYREDSDIIINNNKSFENSLEVIRAFIQSKLA
ncbi:MAG: uridine kinase family protein, partial [Saprospiraceae bacterium]